jgi:dTDP-4-dehydrorhamnose 3,5-epimerase
VKFRQLSIAGAWEIVPVQHGDARGRFLEWYRSDLFAAEVGRPLPSAQANISVSARDVVRGVHFAQVPDGQAKYITCVRGAVLDVVVDIRVGSPTFGRWESLRLDDVDRRSVFLGEGLGHGFRALTDDATMVYVCSTPYNPEREHAIHPLDPALGIDWQVDEPVLSARDATAPTLARAAADGLLPDAEVCRSYVESLRPGENTRP